MKSTEPIHFKADLLMLKHQALLRLPEGESAKLPSRGQVAVHGTINGHGLRTVLEPDGYFGHWMRVDAGLLKETGLSEGDSASVNLEVATEWPDPEVPEDLATALSAAPQKVQDRWTDITPMARWEWVRWVNETRSRDTRAIRIEKTISKLDGKHRRPCCFNLAGCTDPELSRSGKLIDPPKAK
ncbi:MAG: YdeI/OmpD-associated family protein [Chloroflexi bacterium]|nr:YdeI/OmpD-associated family protein [Chloroflexota bacterium]